MEVATGTTGHGGGRSEARCLIPSSLSVALDRDSISVTLAGEVSKENAVGATMAVPIRAAQEPPCGDPPVVYPSITGISVHGRLLIRSMAVLDDAMLGEALRDGLVKRHCEILWSSRAL